MNTSVTLARQRVRYGDFSTRAVRTSGRGPLLVLLHGYADSADTWAAVQVELGAAGWSTLAVDLPGLGEASRLRPGPVLPQLRAFVEALVAAEGAQTPVVLVGNSLGSCAALLAVAAGTPALGVVTTAEPTLGTSWLIRRFRAVPTPLVLRLLMWPLPVPALLTGPLAALAVRTRLYARGRTADPAVIRRFAVQLRQGGGHHVLIRGAHGLAQESVDIYDFDRITCRLLVVHGRHDRVIPTNAARALHAAVPHSDLLVHPDWGHCPQLDDPAGVARMVADFSAACSAGSGDADGAAG